MSIIREKTYGINVEKYVKCYDIGKNHKRNLEYLRI